MRKASTAAAAFLCTMRDCMAAGDAAMRPMPASPRRLRRGLCPARQPCGRRGWRRGGAGRCDDDDVARPWSDADLAGDGSDADTDVDGR